MISLRKSVDELDLFACVVECYTSAIDSSAQYAVEVDANITAEYRRHLKAMEEQSRGVLSADGFRSVQSSFRGELREYRDKCDVHLSKLRKDLADASAAMALFAETVASSGTNHRQEVDQELRALEFASRKDSIDDVRGGIRHSVDAIKSSVERMQHCNELVTAQLQDEIRVLHRQIDLERKALYTDPASGAWTRQKIDLHIDNLLRQNQPFCLLLVCVRNLKRIEGQHSRTVVEGILKSLHSRFAVLIGVDPMIGRWSPDKFVAVLDILPAESMPLSAEAAQKLSGCYSVQENGLAQKVIVQAAAGVLDSTANADAQSFHTQLKQLASAVSGA